MIKTNVVRAPSSKEHSEASASSCRRVIACVDGSEPNQRIIPHALAVATALDAPLTLLRVVEPPPADSSPQDPVEWEFRRREALDDLDRLAQRHGAGGGRIEAEIVDGQPAEQIASWARDHQVDLIVLSTRGEHRTGKWSLGSTARSLAELECGSLLFVPPSMAEGPVPSYRRLLVPLDGSCRAESVLPRVTRLAQAHDAEILLAHAVPVPELTEIGPLEAEDLALRERLVRRNELVGQRYLNRIRGRLADNGVTVRGVVLRGGDIRSGLVDLAIREHVDLIVLAAHGCTGRPDVPYGSVTGYMMTHSPVPLLVVRPLSALSAGDAAAMDKPAKVRMPGRAAL
jgi:nucleotide-binding universal stress UspA family protein